MSVVTSPTNIHSINLLTDSFLYQVYVVLIIWNIKHNRPPGSLSLAFSSLQSHAIITPNQSPLDTLNCEVSWKEVTFWASQARVYIGHYCWWKISTTSPKSKATIFVLLRIFNLHFFISICKRGSVIPFHINSKQTPRKP